MIERNENLIEIITIRLNLCGDSVGFQEIMGELAKASAGEAGPVSIKLYRSERVENDWAIHLSYPSTVKGDKSLFAANLAEVLHSIGLVHRNVWRSYELNTPQTQI